MRSFLPAILFFAVFFFPPLRLTAQESAPVPDEFKDLYSQLERQLDSFNEFLATRHPAQEYPVVFSAELLTAASDRGAQLLTPEAYQGIEMELNSLKKLGVQGVVLSIDFPLLYPGFYSDPAEYLAYAGFYKRLAADIRSRGMKLIVRSGVDREKTKFYRALNFKKYLNARLSAALIIAREVSPDYFCVIGQPDIEAAQSGKPMNNLRNFIKMADTVAEGVKAAAIPGVSIGAGIGSWQSGYQDFIFSLAKIPGLDFIDIQVYPVNRDFLKRVVAIADLARAHRKRVAMSGAWLQKSRLREDARGVLSTKILSRDVFSFWEPLDQKFVAAVAGLSRAKEFEFLSFARPRHFYAYLDYAQSRALSPRQAIALSAAEATKAMLSGELTGVAEAYSALIRKE